MPLNFPTSPSTNDEYSFGAKTWVYNGAGWALKSIPLTTANVNESGNLYYTDARVYANVELIGYASNAYVNTRLATKANVSDLTTANVTEVTNLYFTNTRAIGSLTAGTGIVVESNGLILSTVTGDVVSVNGETGTVVLTTANISEDTNLYYTDDRVYANVELIGYASNTYVNNRLATKANVSDLNTSNVTEGINLYFTNTRSFANILSASTTSLQEGTNLYYTNARVYSNVIQLGYATIAYVDEVAEGLKTKPAVEIATTISLTATYNNGNAGVGATLTANANGAFPAIDGITLASTTPGENGVLVKNQTNKAHNGRYNLTRVGNASATWQLTRCALCDEADEIPGTFTFVKQGTLYAGTGWVQIVDNPDTFVVGTDDINVFQFSGAGTYSAGDGLDLTGTEFAVDSTVVRDQDLTTANVIESGNLYFTDARVYANVVSIGFASNAYVNTRLLTKANTSDKLSVFASTTSAELAGVISNETGSGNLVFNASPTFTGTPQAPTAAIGTANTMIATTAFAANASALSSGIVNPSRISGSYTGITGVGTIAAGTWQGSSISTTYTAAKITSVAGQTGAISNAQLLAALSAVDGVGSGLDADVLDGLAGGGAGAYALKANNLSVFASTTSAQLAGVISDETGSGSLVFSTAPTLSNVILSSFVNASGGNIWSSASTVNLFRVGNSSQTLNIGSNVNTTSVNINAFDYVDITSTTGTNLNGLGTFVNTPLFVGSGTLAEIYTDKARADVFNTVTTGNIFTSATVITIGASTGTTTVRNNLLVGSNISSGNVIATSTSRLGNVTSGVWQGSSISTTYTDAKVTSVNGSTGAITGLATLVSPTFTGTPQAPTAAIGTANTMIATTAFASNATNLGSGVVASARVVGSYGNITGVGTIATGTWQGSSISTTYTDAKVTNITATTPIVANAAIGSVGLSHATSGAAAGTYGNATTIPVITVNSTGHITSIANVATTGGGGGASVTIASVAPGSASAGDLYWDDELGRLFIYYNDGSSSQWVDASPMDKGIGLRTTNNNTTHYVTFVDTTSGSFDYANISQSGLYFIPSTGSLNATNFNSLSDIALKEDIKPIKNHFELIDKINPVSFKWKNNNLDSYGVIAQQIEEILPNLVSTNDDGIKSVSYIPLIGILISCVKELKEEINILKKSK